MQQLPIHLAMSDFELEGGVRVAIWHAHIPETVTWEQVLKPEFWAHVAEKVGGQRNARDHQIIVTHKAKQFSGMLEVLAVEKVSMVVAPIHYVEFEQNREKATVSGFDIVLRGVHKWSIVRQSDKEVVKDGFATRVAAAGWLEQYRASLTQAA